MSRSAFLASLAAVTMLAWPSAPARTAMLHMKMCGGGTIDIPVPGKDKPARDRDCPAGCHAPLCQQRKRGGGHSV